MWNPSKKSLLILLCLSATVSGIAIAILIEEYDPDKSKFKQFILPFSSLILTLDLLYHYIKK